MRRQLEIAFVFLLIIISFKFFDALFLNDSIVNYILYLTLISGFLISIPFLVPENKGFVFPIQLIFVSVLISILMANLYWDQSITDNIIASLPFLIIAFFFYLLHVKFPVPVLEKIILAYGVIYILLYAFQLMNSSTVLFHSAWGDEFNQTRGIARIVFPGGGVFILSSFIAINKLTSQNKHKWFWIILTICGVLIPILQVTRQFIAGIAIIYLYHILRTLSTTKKIFIFGSLIVLFFYIINIDNPIISGLVETTQSDTSSGADYIRVLAGKYFLFDFSPNLVTTIFGNGIPYSENTNYGFFIEMLSFNQYYYLSDVGIIAVYVMFGIPAILGFLIIWVKSFTIPLPKEYQYLKYYLWFLLFTSLTWYTVYHYYYLIITVYVLYMYQSVYEKQLAENEQSQVIERS